MDRIRAILLDIEEKDTGNGYQQFPKLKGYSEAELNYHCHIMKEAGLIRMSEFEGGGGIVHNMTWNGHEFIALSSNSEVWNKTKKTLLDKGIDFTMDIGVKLLTKFRDELLNI